MARTSLGWSTPTILLLLSPLPILANSLSHGQIPLYDSASPIDISGAKFQGLNTYANLPYVHCLSNGEVEEYDIAILGAPFDTVSPPDSLQGENTIDSWAKIIDCGDVPMTFLDNTVALKQLDEGHR
ncbi:hypothetical protein V491_06880, partial [Pseudogymnoascus sp. VKM F-3775]